MLGFFSAYSELQTGMAAYHPEYDVVSLCDPKSLRDPKLLKRPKEYPDPHAFYLKENDCHALYTEGWNQGHTQGTQAYETRDLELIGEIARLAGRLAPFYTAYTTAENDARDCKVLGEIRTRIASRKICLCNSFKLHTSQRSFGSVQQDHNSPSSPS